MTSLAREGEDDMGGVMVPASVHNNIQCAGTTAFCLVSRLREQDMRD